MKIIALFVFVLTALLCDGQINATTNNEYRIHPNPIVTKGVIRLKDRTIKIKSFDIINLQGAIVKSNSRVAINAIYIDRTGMPNGIYFLRIETKNGENNVVKFVTE